MHVLEIMKTHPGTQETSVPLVATIESCFDCAQTCAACADACLAEPDPAALARCIRICGECADISAVTGDCCRGGCRTTRWSGTSRSKQQ